mmetsp:Transcript_3901/g.12611  ORF Transcript_3901/g.12611 Transcript_3901/m.12611 type:complete len:322 (-) Transcript_3901:57-1022(-)
MKWLLLAAVPVVARTQDYDTALAKKLVLLSDAAYCGDATHGGTEGVREWTCAPCQAGASLSNISVFANSLAQTFGFAGVTAGWDEGQHIVVSFRGSVLDRNFADDADVQLVADPSGRAGRVHRGMHRSFVSVAPQMLERVRSLLAGFPDARGVLITGHSLGAAQAVLATDELAAAHPGVSVTAYTFGTPRVADLAFARRLAATPNLQAWAVSHRADTVPMCGILPWPCRRAREGYHQLLSSVWYPDGLAPVGPSGYILCGDGGSEGERCEDGVPPRLLNWDDHNLYLGHTMFCCDGGSHGTSGSGCPFPFRSPAAAATVYA